MPTKAPGKRIFRILRGRITRLRKKWKSPTTLLLRPSDHYRARRAIEAIAGKQFGKRELMFNGIVLLRSDSYMNIISATFSNATQEMADSITDDNALLRRLTKKD